MRACVAYTFWAHHSRLCTKRRTCIASRQVFVKTCMIDTKNQVSMLTIACAPLIKMKRYMADFASSRRCGVWSMTEPGGGGGDGGGGDGDGDGDDVGDDDGRGSGSGGDGGGGMAAVAEMAATAAAAAVMVLVRQGCA